MARKLQQKVLFWRFNVNNLELPFLVLALPLGSELISCATSTAMLQSDRLSRISSLLHFVWLGHYATSFCWVSQNNCHFLMRSMNKHKFYAIHVDQKHYIIVWKATVHWNSSLSTHCIVNDSQNHDPRIIKIKSVHQQPTTFQYHYYACLTILLAVTLAFTFRQFCNFAEGR